MEHRLCLGDIMDPASPTTGGPMNMQAELLALKGKVSQMEQVNTPTQTNTSRKAKKSKDKKDKKDKSKLSQDELLKRLNENLAATCTLYNLVIDRNVVSG